MALRVGSRLGPGRILAVESCSMKQKVLIAALFLVAYLGFLLV